MEKLTERAISFILLAVLVLSIFIGMWWTFNGAKRAKQEAVDAKGGRVVAEGQSRVGDKINEATSDLATRQAAREQLTRDNQDAINANPHAGDAVDPGLHADAIRVLCARDANAAKAACVRLRQAGSAAASR